MTYTIIAGNNETGKVEALKMFTSKKRALLHLEALRLTETYDWVIFKG